MEEELYDRIWQLEKEIIDLENEKKELVRNRNNTIKYLNQLRNNKSWLGYEKIMKKLLGEDK